MAAIVVVLSRGWRMQKRRQNNENWRKDAKTTRIGEKAPKQRELRLDIPAETFAFINLGQIIMNCGATMTEVS